MPLPEPSCARKPGHTRTITVRSFAREDGLWDLEGHLTDIWPHEVPVAGGRLPPHEPMHEMWLRLTVDRTAAIVAVEATTDAGPYGSACSSINPAYRQLVGVRIGRGYRDAIRRLFGRTAGCTHMNELATVMGSAILQALWSEMVPNSAERPLSIDGCHALKSDGPQVAQFFPRWYRPASEPDAATDMTSDKAAPSSAG